jgi:tetratricopeptide (TPR) repeat protein
MRIDWRFLGVWVFAAAATAYALSPGSEEQLAMLARDGRSSEAASELARLLALGRRDPAFLAAAARALESTGDRVLAEDLLERYLVERPGDVQALDWLAGLYQASDDRPAATRTLATLVALAPTRPRLWALLDLYRAQDRLDEERAVLKGIADEAMLRPVDVERLGILLSWAGERPAALAALRRADALIPAVQETGRIVLFDLLLAEGLRDEAFERAGRWIADWRDKPWLGVHVVRRMAARGDPAAAVALGAQVTALSPGTRFYLARVVAEDGNRRIATTLLEDWARGGPEPSSDEVAGYVAAAYAVGDLAALWRKAASLLAEPGWHEAQIAIVEALALRYGLDAIAPLRPRLSWAALRRQPLFAARLALHEGNPVLARRALEAVEPETLNAPARAEWVALVSLVSGDAKALAALGDLLRRDRLPTDLIPVQLRLAQRLGDAVAQRLGLDALRRSARPPIGAQAHVPQAHAPQSQVQQAQVHQAKAEPDARRMQ